MNISLDPKLPVRGIDFNNLIILLHAVNSLTPIRYTDALSLVTERKVIVSSKNPGEALKKSSFYHHWAALKLLGLIDQLPNRLYDLSDRGHHLVEVTPQDEMNYAAKSIFREGMLTNADIWENFWILFTCQTTPTLKPQIGHIVAFRPTSSTTYEKTSNTRHYVIEGTCQPYRIEPSDARIYQVVISGFRRWAEQCGLVDEIFPPTTSRLFHGISSFMYLIDVEKEAKLTTDTITEFISKNQDIADPILSNTLRFDIPDLLARICSSEGIRLALCQRLLLDWVDKNKQTVALERPSLGLIEVQRGKRNPRSTERSQPWLTRKELKYTTLLVSRAAFG